MKKLRRSNPPDCLDNDIEKSRQKKIKFYDNLRDKSGNIRDRWNSTCKDKDGISKIRKKLLEMSEGHCAFCGVKIDDTQMDVEHFLPKEGFEYLSYCWENYLPSCKTCNQNHKGTFIPESLKNKELIESILSSKFPNTEIYKHKDILKETVDRIIEPTFDNPEEHLEFLPEFLMYDTKTAIGKITNNMFFKHKEVTKKWQELSKFIQEIVKNSANPEDIVQSYINLSGFAFISLKFLDYWLEEKEAGRIDR